MHPLEAAILETFKQDPNKRFTTTALVHAVFKEEYAQINPLLHSDDRKQQRAGFGKKAHLHRKLLYHVNKLVEKGLLKEEGVRGKGEKVLSLALEEGELVIQEERKRIVIARRSSLTTQMDGFEQDGLLRKYRPESWLNKQNAVLLDAEKFADCYTLQERLQQVLPLVNDVVALYGFESLIMRSKPDELAAFLQYLALDAHDYDVRIALLINLDGEEERILSVTKSVLEQGWTHVQPVFSMTHRTVTRKENLVRDLLALFAERRAKLHLKNASIFPAPLFYGRAGGYSLTPEEWTLFQTKLKKTSDGCVVGGISVAIDLGKLFEEKRTPAQLREMLLKVAHGFFDVEERRRKYATELQGLSPGTPEGLKDFFRLGKHYIRLWNYEWDADYPIIELLESGQSELDAFSVTEETIFRSCGMPIRFHIGMSTCFAKFDQDAFSERRYTKTVVSSLKDIQTKEMTKYLRTRERMYKLFQGADRLRFFFARATPVEETVQIARYLLRAYDLPGITFDFHGKSGELKLTSFLDEAK